VSDIVLWSYDASPFTQKTLRMLGLKGLAWRWVETPMMPPKDDLVALTGGYRGTPVMQIGADVYIDYQLIAAELEQRFPSPTLFPGGDRGLAFMLVKWSDAFFRTGLAVTIQLLAAQWPEAFLADRKHLFPDLDWNSAMRDSSHARSQFRVHAGLLDRQLGDGRSFLTGDAPGLADIQAHVFVWMARSYFTDVAATLLGAFVNVIAWEERMSRIGDGERNSVSATEAFARARAARPGPSVGVDAQDPLAFAAGERVVVTPDDTRRGGVEGDLVTLQWNEVAVRRRDERCGEVVVHFPRMAYRVTRA
jgi:glutathione S-transferase